jgi:hypothetical protein
MRRVEMAARDYANADSGIRQIRWGRVLAFLEVGVAFGYWSKRSADRAADSIYHRWALGRLRRTLKRPQTTATRQVPLR